MFTILVFLSIFNIFLPLLFNLIIDGFLSRHCDESHCLFYETKINKNKQKKAKKTKNGISNYPQNISQCSLLLMAVRLFIVWFSGRIMSEHRLNEEYNF